MENIGNRMLRCYEEVWVIDEARQVRCLNRKVGDVYLAILEGSEDAGEIREYTVL